MVLRRLTMRKHGEQASRSGPPNNSNTPSYSRNVPPSLTSASTMDHHYPLHAISQQPRNRSTSDSNWSMQARWSPTSTSWSVCRRHRSRAAQLWAKVMRNAKPTFIDAGLNLNTALRRGGVLVQWLNRCTDSALSRCFLLAFVCSEFESANIPPIFDVKSPPGFAYPSHGKGFVLLIVWTLIFHLMLAGIAAPCLPRACKRGGPAAWPCCCVCLDTPLRFNTLGKATASSTNSTQNTSSKSA
jgi:hypothetical protein